MTDPNAADWLTAIGTVGTLTATVALFWWDRRQGKKRERRAQAGMISGWADSVNAHDDTRTVNVLNMSDEPVYNINVFLEDEDNRDEDDEDIAEKPIGPSTTNKRFLSVLPPKQLVTWDVSRRDPASAGPRTAPRVGLLFDDRNGARWFRNWNGKVIPDPRDNPNSHRPEKRLSDVERPRRKWIE